MTLLIDSREPDYIKESCIEFMKHKLFNAEVKELPEGDFKFEKVIFERKEINDFNSSIIDKRIKNQKYKLLKKQNEGYHIYWLIMGTYKDINPEHRLPRQVIASEMASITERGMSILQCSQYDLMFLYEAIYHVIKNYNVDKPVEKVFIEPDVSTWTQKCLMCIPGVGKKTSKLIIDEIPHMQRFYETRPETLQKSLEDIKGVGKITAKNIVEAIYD